MIKLQCELWISGVRASIATRPCRQQQGICRAKCTMERITIPARRMQQECKCSGHTPNFLRAVRDIERIKDSPRNPTRYNLCTLKLRKFDQNMSAAEEPEVGESGFSGHIIPCCFLLLLLKECESLCLALDYVCIRHDLRRTQPLAKIVNGSTSLLHPSTPTLWPLQVTFTKVSFYGFLLAAK